VTAGCADLEAALRGDDPERLAAFERHAATCPACGPEWALLRAIEAAAPSLRQSWPSPGLEARIRSGLLGAAEGDRARRFRSGFWLPLAAAAAVGVAALAVLGRSPGPGDLRRGPSIPSIADEGLLTERALDEVEKAEAAYVAAIDALARVAEGRLAEAESPLLAGYREKLLLLDSAIADCRAQADGNRFNAHLRLELLSVYREKQRTLESLLKEDLHAS
jgi:hypothetical protein